MGCVTPSVILAHVLSPLSGKLCFKDGFVLKQSSVYQKKGSILHSPLRIKAPKMLLWMTKIVLLVFGCFFLLKFFQTYLIGTVLINRQYYSNDTLIYWFITIGYLVVASGLILKMFRIKIKT
jgi:hypothetical protein